MIRILSLFLNNRHLVSMCVVAVFAAGLIFLYSIPREAFPNVDTNRVTIAAVLPGGSPEDVELNVTVPIEEHLRSVQGIEDITSVSQENYSSIVIQVDQNFSEQKKKKVVDDIRRAVDRIIDFPPEMRDRPIIRELRTCEIPIVELAVSADDPLILRKAARDLEQKIARLPGVGMVEKIGYYKKEVHVEVNPRLLRKYDLTLSDIFNAVRHRNIQSSAGTMESYRGLKNVVVHNRFRKPSDVLRVILRSNFDQKQTTLRQVATVSDTVRNERMIVRNNGRPGITLVIKRKESADIVNTIDNVRRFMEKHTPKGVSWALVNDKSGLTRSRVDLLTINGIIGFLCVVVLLLFFLNWKIALWTAFGIPFSFFAVFILLPVFGITINAISLAGMIVVLGMVVDDAIVVGECIGRFQENGISPKDASHRGVRLMAAPVIAAALTTIAAYSMMFFLGGLQGKFAQPLPVVVILVLALSLFESLFLLPSHLSHGKIRVRPRPPWMVKMEHGYTSLLQRALKNRYRILLLFILFLMFTALFVGNSVRFELLPQSGAETFYIKVEGPRGQALGKTLRQIKTVEQAVASLPKNDLASFSSRVGHMEPLPEKNMGEHENQGIISVYLTPESIRKRTADRIIAELRKKIPKMAKVNCYFEINKVGPVTGRPVRILISGGTRKKREQAEKRVLAFLRRLVPRGVLDPESDRKKGKDELVVRPLHSRLAAYGLSVRDVSRCLRLALEGAVATSVRNVREETDFRILLNRQGRSRIDIIRNLGVRNVLGRIIPLKNVIRFLYRNSVQKVRHHNGQRSITISAGLNAGKMSVFEVARLLRKNVLKRKQLPGDPEIRMIGEVVESKRTMRDTTVAFVFAVFMIFSILAVMLKSWTQPIIIMSVIPFGAIGVLWVVYFQGLNISMYVLLGIVSLSGIVVNDSIVMVDTLNAAADGKNRKLIPALVESAATRFRPVLLTTLTTVAGLFPMAYGLGGYDTVISPMGLAVGWGLIFATLITLFLIPAMYLIRRDIKDKIQSLSWSKVRD